MGKVEKNGKKWEKMEKIALCPVMLFDINTCSIFLTATPNSKWGPHSRTRFSLMLVSCFTRRARDKWEYASEQILCFYDLQVTKTFNKLHQLCFGIVFSPLR